MLLEVTKAIRCGTKPGLGISKDGVTTPAQIPKSDVSSGKAAPGPLPAAGGGHRAWVADGVPQRPRAEALAVQTVERLTDT